MTEILYKCDKHGNQKVQTMYLPNFVYTLECGCVYSSNIHGSNYRINTTTCDECDKLLGELTFIRTGYSSGYFHPECAEKHKNDKHFIGKIIKTDTKRIDFEGVL